MSKEDLSVFFSSSADNCILLNIFLVIPTPIDDLS